MTTTQRTCNHVELGQICPLEAEHQLYDEHMTRLQQEQGQRLYDLNDDRATLETEIEYGLYCERCHHGNGCEHGVPMPRW